MTGIKSSAQNDILSDYAAAVAADSPVLSTDSVVQSVNKLMGNTLYDRNINYSTGILSWDASSLSFPTASTMNLPAGSGIIVTAGVEQKINWAEMLSVAIQHIGTSTASVLAIDNNGDLQQFAITAVPADINTAYIKLISLGLAGGGVSQVFSTNYPIFSPYSSLRDFASAVGLVNISGNVFSANGANMMINKSVGVTFGLGINTLVDIDNPNFKTNEEGIPATFARAYNTAGGLMAIDGAPTTLINAAQYDNLSGTLQAVPSNRWTIQRIYTFPDGDIVVPPNIIYGTSGALVTYGQVLYTSLDNALTALNEATQNAWAELTNSVFRGWIIAKGNTTALNNTADNAFKEATSEGGSATTAPISASALITNDGTTAPAAGQLGEYVSAIGGASVLFTNNVWTNVTSIVLQPGIWTLNAINVVNIAATPAITEVRTFFGLNSGNSGTGIQLGVNASYQTWAVASTIEQQFTQTIPQWKIEVPPNTTTTVYLKCKALFTTGQINSTSSSISGVRRT